MPFAWPRVFLLTNQATGTMANDCNVVVVLRHDAIPYAFQSEIWDKPDNDPPFFDTPKAPPEECAEAIVAAIEGERFETYTPDMQQFVVGKTGDVDGFLATMAGLRTGSSTG